jgi:hypothetical protein
VAYVRKVRTASGAVAVQIARMDEVTFLRSLRSCSRSDMAELGTRTKCVGGRWDHRESVPTGEGRIVLDVVRYTVMTTRRNMD